MDEAWSLASVVTAAVWGIPLLLPVMAGVEYFKSFKRKDGSQLFTGNALLLLSLGWGLLLGTGYCLVVMPVPVAGTAWQGMFAYGFGVFMYGITIGLLAAGIYKVGKGFIEKAIAKFFEKFQISQINQGIDDGKYVG